MRTLGIDTSNYTCSVAVYDDESETITMKKQLLSITKGTVGLRQSQAVFEQVRLLGQQTMALFQEIPGPIDAVGASVRPRTVEGSYMPCFLVGKMAAEVLSAVIACPMTSFSHQQGHLAAALYSAEKLDWLFGEPHTFYAFHLSGGTTECLLVTAGNGNILEIERLGGSLDLHVGQVIDRVGQRLGLPFPAGPELEKLAETSSQEALRSFHMAIPNKGCDCCLSGLENLCEKQLLNRKPPEEIARFCFDYICRSVESMLQNVFAIYGKQPVLFAGGVSGNKFLQKYLEERYDSVFAKPEFSSDNAAGIAVLTCLGERNASL